MTYLIDTVWGMDGLDMDKIERVEIVRWLQQCKQETVMAGEVRSERDTEVGPIFRGKAHEMY